MKKQINEIKRMQQLAGVLKEEAVPYAQWKSALTQFIEKNLTNDIDENENLIQVLQNIIDELKQEIDGGLNEENQLNEAEGQEVADFLNTHYDEVFEKIIKPAINYQGEMPEKFLNPELFDRWRIAATMEEDDLSHCAELAIDDKNLPGIGFMATFEPFTEEDSDVLDMTDDVLSNTNNSPFTIAGRKIYMHEYDY